MKTRLAIFIFSLVLLPLGGLLLSGREWEELSARVPAGSENNGAILLTTLMLLAYILLTDYMIKRITGNSPINIQRNYYLWMAAASAILCWLLAYLNLFTASWLSSQDKPVMHFFK